MRPNDPAAGAPQPHILVVDDDQRIRSMLASFLRDHGLRVSQAGDGRQMFTVLEAARIDTVVLDVMMPGEDGISLCRRLRSESTVPIILLTAVSGETDRIVGLEVGADDYVTKPFNPRELLARIRAVLRRVAMLSAGPRESRQAIYRFNGWRLDPTRRTLHSPGGALTDLTSGEFDLLAAFAEHPQRVLTRDQLLDLARGRSAAGFDRSIDVQISRLRRKIEDNPQDPSLIKTVRNEGYYFAADVGIEEAGR